MRLSPFDDYPFHQHPAPFHQVATTDAHYNDGYFMAFYAPDWYFCAGLRLHPNVNVMDGWSTVAHENRQRSVRISRALHPRVNELSVGPLAIDIIEPMTRIALRLDENPSGLTFAVELSAQSPPFVEERYQHMKFGAVVNDLIRYTQICRAVGQAILDGHEIEIDQWHAMRDHSWGVRSSMGIPTGIQGIDRTEREADRRALRLWVPFEVEDHAGFFNTHEDSAGNTLDFEGRLDFSDGDTVKLIAVRHELTYRAGTSRPSGGVIELDGEDGSTRRYELELVGTPADVQGGGYYRGWRDGLGPGIYRGSETTEHDAYDVTPGAKTTGPPHVPEKYRLGPTEFPMRITAANGALGMAHFEHTISGPYPRYGFA
ncbi:MAG: hypothetical protein AAF384_18690 [Pseudomonadota bacterium]